MMEEKLEAPPSLPDWMSSQTGGVETKRNNTKRLREAEHTRRHTVAGEGARPLYTSGLMMQNSWEGEVRSYATDMYVVRKRGKVGERNQKITQVRMSLGYPTRAPVEAGPPSGWPVIGYNVLRC